MRTCGSSAAGPRNTGGASAMPTAALCRHAPSRTSWPGTSGITLRCCVNDTESKPDFSSYPMKLYNELASWWPLMSPPAEYTEEAGFYLKAMHGAAHSPVHSALELGSGGGHNASHMKQHLREMVLV